jgi:hypothetical protein
LIPPAKSEPPGGDIPTGGGNGGKWLAKAISEAQGGNRNHTGYRLAGQLRDDNLPMGQMVEVMRKYALAVQNRGDHPYTEAEALKSLQSALHRPKRPPAHRPLEESHGNQGI